MSQHSSASLFKALMKYLCAELIFFFQLSFQEWTQQIRDMLEARKRGDLAFRDTDFKTAIECYSEVFMYLVCCETD